MQGRVGSAADMADGLRIRGLDVRYDRVEAVSGLDLTVAPGEIVAVLGRSGSGKSSLLRAIAGTVVPAAGTIEFDGDDVLAVKPHKRDFGLMLSGPNLFPRYNVAKNVEYGLGKWPRRDRARRVAEVLGRLGLSDLADLPVTGLSEGQGQRVALARSLAPRPRLLLLDEPLGGVEGAERTELVSELVRLIRDEDVTALYVTHAHDEALAIADHVGVLQAGELVQFGTPEQILRTPSSRAVAEFLGYGPFISGTVQGPDVVTALGAVPNPGLSGDVLVGLGREGLRVVESGRRLRVRSEQARMGYAEVAVRLPDSQTARLHIPEKTGLPEIAVAIDPADCVVVPD